MEVTYFNPTSTSGSGGYINYKMSGGGSSAGSGPGCGFWGWVLLILVVLSIIGKLY